MKLLSIFGTRPEAVKMAPILIALEREPGIHSLVCVTGQHRLLLDQALDFFSILPDFDLDLMRPGQPLNMLLSRAIERLDPILAAAAPDRVIVQGDTSTALAAALAAFHRSIPVAHVEAGLRTYCPGAPFPEEANRRAIALVADLHFAPTPAARDNLAAERLRGAVHVTGNSGVDALHLVLAVIDADARLRRRIEAALPRPGPAASWSSSPAIAARASERRSPRSAPRSTGSPLGRMSRSSSRAIPIPRSPAEPAPACAPLDLPSFVQLMRRADLVLTDSGGVQEEAVTLGKPVIVLRDSTERAEGVAGGAAILAGTDADRIVRAAEARLDGAVEPAPRRDLYGDGRAAGRIVDGLLGRPVEPFAPADPAGRDRLRQIG